MAASLPCPDSAAARAVSKRVVYATVPSGSGFRKLASAAISEVTCGVRTVFGRSGAVLCGSTSVCGGIVDVSVAEPPVKVSGVVVSICRALLSFGGSLG